MPQIFKTKCLVNFRKYRSRKKVLIWWSKKRQNQIRLKNPEELIAGYQEVESKKTETYGK